MTTPRDPAPLPRNVRALLAEYRDAHELPEEARDRIWSVVGADDAPEPAFDPLEHETDARPRSAAAERRRPRKRSRAAIAGGHEGTGSRRGSVRWLALGTAALAAAAVLALAWQLGGTLAERRKASRAPDAAVMQGGGGSTQGRAGWGTDGRAKARGGDSAADPSASPGSGREPIVVPDPSGSSAPLDRVGSSPRSAPLDPSGSTAGSTREPPRSNGAAPDTARTTPSLADPPRSEPGVDALDPTLAQPGSTLVAERELVARAWRALALGETAQALDAASEHARRFPAGLLAPERAAIDTIARCRRGDADGPRRASSFHRANPRSPLAERVDEACTADSKSSTTP